MLLKRFEAPTLPEALAKVEAECGQDALLVETKATSRGYVVVASRSKPTEIPRPPKRDKPVKWTRGFAPIAKHATEFGISSGVLRAVEKALIGTQVRVDVENDPSLPRVTTKVLEALIPTTDLADARVLAFVGPTGVGKTTTLAKIAARHREAGESVAIVTIDTYRMAAVEQLRAMAEMLDVPFEVAFTPVDLRRAVERHKDADRILIDTTGRSPLDRDALRNLHGMLHPCRAHVVLCLTATSRRADVELTFENFDALGIDSVILTKWDETRVPGEALSFAIEQGVAISHITVGQEVPDDIVDADSTAIAASALAATEAELEALL